MYRVCASKRSKGNATLQLADFTIKSLTRRTEEGGRLSRIVAVQKRRHNLKCLKLGRIDTNLGFDLQSSPVKPIFIPAHT